ncbi:MAG: carbamoyltransferase [Ignavibacteria bacterium]|jgi:carbamoyltransferase
MNILGISAFYHDSASAIIQDEKIIAAAHEERFTRKKQDKSFPLNSIKFCLTYSGLKIDELDAVIFYDKPLLKFERLLETYYGFAPKGLLSYIQAIPVWIKEKLFMKKVIYDELKKIEVFNKKKLKLLFSEHHLSHAASAFYPSSFESAAILTIDGVGEWATASICHGQGNKIEMLKEMRFPHSLGLLYSAFTYYLGFVVNSGEYKLMGLAPYGNPNSENTKKYIQILNEILINVKEDGSIWLNQKYFKYATGLRMVDDKQWSRLFGFQRRLPEDKIEQHHSDCAYAIQKVTEDIIIKMAQEAKRLTNEKYLCLAGGVALNCVANGKLLEKGLFDDIYIQPASGDAGGAIGAALATHYIYYDNKRIINNEYDKMQGAYLGPEYSGIDIELVSKQYKAKYKKYESFEDLIDEAAILLTKGNVVGWFQGRMEFGPRALGNRSILGDARNPEMQKKLNLKIKYREGFRPFAPSVLYEDSPEFFNLKIPSPYMLIVADVIEKRRKELPRDYYELPLMERLYIQRSDVQAITHIDMSARIQTVHKETNEKYWKLINKFKEKTGYGIIVNTSFNVRGEPIICTPNDAYRCFMRTEMDYLVMGNYLYKKTEQPNFKDTENWKETFKLD